MGMTNRLESVFSWADAMSCGMTRRQGNHLAGQRVLRGYYSFTAAVPLRVRVQAALSVAGHEGVVCGPTSLSLAGVDLPQRLGRDARMWIQVPSAQTWPTRPEIRLVRTSRLRPTTRILGLPSLELPYCWLQLAPELSIRELVELADAMTRRQHPACTKDSLAEAIDSSPGARGVPKARAALGLAQEGTDSIPETDLRLLLVRAGLPAPTVNLMVVDGTGRRYYLDLAYEHAKLAIEYDGAYHVSDRAQMHRDAARRRALEDQGWRIITITAADLATDPAGVVASVRQALGARC